jgi:hypothetical protein
MARQEQVRIFEEAFALLRGGFAGKIMLRPNGESS